MDIGTTLLIFISLILAVALSFFQYYFKEKNKTNLKLILSSLRFLSIFGILLLLINPVIATTKYQISKPPLPIVIDNSISIDFLNAKTISLELARKISTNQELNDKFSLQLYKFDNNLESSDSTDFKGRQTNIDKVGKGLQSNFKNTVYPTILITDGNQTSGNDYVYSFNSNNKVFPIILGDTTAYLDIKINAINVNKFAFYKNKFPAEVFLQYSGNKPINGEFKITNGKNTLSSQTVSFSKTNQSAVINVLLPAEKVGVQTYKASVDIKASVKEKNTYNNVKNFAVQIIDKRMEIAIVSAISHPDIGVLKRSIEANDQRKVTVFKPNEIKSLKDYAIVIMYQPTDDFKPVFELAKVAGINTFIITGNNTNYNFLNRQQTDLQFNMTSQKEDFLPMYNSDFKLFISSDIGFYNLPPLQNSFGTVGIKGNLSVLLYSKIRSVKTDIPMLGFIENGSSRKTYLLGENIWKWRLQTFADNQSFDKFDLFLDKTIQFLSSSLSKQSLVVSHESFYNSGDEINITAQYFDLNYQFDENARLSINITNAKTKETKEYELQREGSFFEVNLSSLTAGEYNFAVKELNSNTVYSNYFQVLDFDIEKQFVNPDVNKLKQLANQTRGSTYLPNQLNSLIERLCTDETYKAIEKKVVTKTAIIDWKLLLLLIIASLAIEWFLRKHNGLL